MTKRIMDMSTKRLQRFYLKQLKYVWTGDWVELPHLFAGEKQGALAVLKTIKEELARRGVDV